MYEENKSIFIIMGGIASAILVIAVIFIMFSGDNKESASPAPEQAAPVATQKSELLQNVIKDSVLRSTDGGETFESYFTIATTAGAKLGLADVLSISFHPKVRDRVIVTTFQDGLFINEGRKNSWKPIEFPPKKIYSFILDKGSPDNRVFASGVVEDNGRIFRTNDAGTNWRAVYSEPGVGTYVSGLAQHPKKFNVILAGTSAGTLIKSLDGGTSWKNLGGKIDGIISNFSFDSKDDQFVYLLTYQSSIYFSKNEGITWQSWAEEKAREIDELRARSRELANKGDRTGSLKIDGQIEALQKKDRENPAPYSILLVVADPIKQGTIYASASGGLYRSTDYGKFWTKINIIESAEKYPIRSIAVSPKNSDEIVFVSGKSFYKSTNWGDTWSVIPLDYTRNTSFVAYDPFDLKTIFIGVSSK